MTDRPEFLQNSMIVAAHPDDELLWFGAILPLVDDVTLVFEEFWPDPDMGPARARAVANFPRDRVSSLRFSEAATYGCANWEHPKLTKWGIELGRVSQVRDAKQKIKRMLNLGSAQTEGIQARYQLNYQRLVDELGPRLNKEMNVFTHNPWGEYGHEDHIQVFRALDQLRNEIGFELWMSNYCSERALPLAKTYFDNVAHDYVTLDVDKVFSDKVAQVYRDAGCWTWSQDWQWFNTECYMRAPRDQRNLATQGQLFPLNFFNIDPN